MESNEPTSSYLDNLYNGYNAVAERVSNQELATIHISTSLDEQIRTWIQNGNDVILTGNPGDGKTHMINILDHKGFLAPAYAERDASQKSAQDILATWMQQKQVGNSFVLAINHAPLRELSRVAQTEAAYQPLSFLCHIPKEIDSLVYYDEPQASYLAHEKVVVVDLSQRNLLADDIVIPLIQKLCSFATASQCSHCPPKRCLVESNAEALSHEPIRKNVLRVLRLVVQRGFHITMRDLTGLFAYLITGDASCATRWEHNADADEQPPHFEDYAYYNLLFRGRSPLFDAIRTTFDPSEYADPETDMQLWQGTVRAGWLMNDPPHQQKQPATLQELRRLKRRYFFEHEHDTKTLLERMMSTSEAEFDKLVTGYCDDEDEVQNLVHMINTLYAPYRDVHEQDPHGYKLRLRFWNSHRYAVGTRPGYVAMRLLPSDKLRIYRPKLAAHLAKALSIRQDHVLFGIHAYRPGDPALHIDWTMYQALTSAKQGKPIDVQPFHLLRRLDLFLRHLAPHAMGPRDIETVEWSNHRQRHLEKVRVNRTKRSYENGR